MTSVSEAQRRLAGIALSIKRGKVPRNYCKSAAQLANSMTEEQLEEFAHGNRISNTPIKKEYLGG